MTLLRVKFLKNVKGLRYPNTIKEEYDSWMSVTKKSAAPLYKSSWYCSL